MKLQLNDAGSWRHVFNFNKADEPHVRLRAVQLVCIHERSKLRILDDANNLRATSRGPDFTWEERQ